MSLPPVVSDPEVCDQLQLAEGWWCQDHEHAYGWLDGSDTACTVEGHHHIRVLLDPRQPEHSLTHDQLERISDHVWRAAGAGERVHMVCTYCGGRKP